MRLLKELAIAIAAGAAIAAAVGLALPVHAQDLASLIPSSTPTPVQSFPDGNYAAALQATAIVSQQQTDAITANAAARAQCYKSLADLASSSSSASSDIARVAGIVALGIACNGGGGQLLASSGPAPVTIPAPPVAPVQVQSGNWMQALINAPAALLDGAVKLGPTIVQYLLGRVSAESQTKIALAQSAERTGLYQVFGGMNATSVNAVSGAAQAGFITIGQLPLGHNVNVTGSSGIGFGSGNVTYSPITSSYNPVTRTCSGGQAGSGGGTTTGAAGGAGGTVGC